MIAWYCFFLRISILILVLLIFLCEWKISILFLTWIAIEVILLSICNFLPSYLHQLIFPGLSWLHPLRKTLPGSLFHNFMQSKELKKSGLLSKLHRSEFICRLQTTFFITKSAPRIYFLMESLEGAYQHAYSLDPEALIRPCNMLLCSESIRYSKARSSNCSFWKTRQLLPAVSHNRSRWFHLWRTSVLPPPFYLFSIQLAILILTTPFFLKNHS